MSSSARRSLRACRSTALNASPVNGISSMDSPLPFQLRNSCCASASTEAGITPGPAAKLNTFAVAVASGKQGSPMLAGCHEEQQRDGEHRVDARGEEGDACAPHAFFQWCGNEAEYLLLVRPQHQ